MNTFELKPHNGRKSFYGKAIVTITDDGIKTLQSYDTVVLSITPDGQLHRHWDTDHPSPTTMTHIKSFIAEFINDDTAESFNSKRYMALDLENQF